MYYTIMTLSDTETLYNFVMEEKKKGIAIRETLKNQGVSTSQFMPNVKS